MCSLISEAKLYALVEQIYAAAQSPSEWQHVLDGIAAAVPKTSAAVLIRSQSAERGLHIVHANFPPGAIDDYMTHHADSSPWTCIFRNVATGEPFATEDHVPLSTIKHSLFYTHFLTRYAIGGGFGVKLWDRLDGRATFMVTCPFDSIEPLKLGMLEIIAKLAPHLQRSLATRWALRRERAKGLEDGLMGQVDPVFILNNRREVIFLNSAACAARDAGIVHVDSVSRQFRLQSRADNATLEALFEAPAGEFATEAAKPRRLMAFSIAGTANPNALELMALPAAVDSAVQDFFGDTSREPRTLLTLRLRAGHRSPRVEDIRAVLGLSPREADVALGLAEGHSPEELAKNLRVTVDTVRWHLKNIYYHVGCSSQSELVRTVLSLVGPARVD